jgi:anthranilate synthase/aminodeoxychorismate synthase-like glutamine amidotransferase
MILLIDNYDSFTYNLYQLLVMSGKEVLVKRNDSVSVDDIKKLGVEKIVLSPGPGRPEDAGVCCDLIRAFYKSVPILGVCLGHQAIAVAFGGKVVQAEQIVHGKETFVFHRRGGVFKNLPLPFVAGRYHSLVVERDTLPAEISVVAENDEGKIMAIKVKDYPVYGLQFHPESILTPQGKMLIDNFLEEK